MIFQKTFFDHVAVLDLFERTKCAEIEQPVQLVPYFGLLEYLIVQNFLRPTAK